MRILVAIPAWNEELSLGRTLDELRAAAPWADAVVVDDGSTDDTADIARARRVAVLQLPINLGVGGAMRAAFRYAERHAYDVVVQLDADGQHDPAHLPEVIAGLADADIVIGSRFAGVGDYDVRGPRRWAMVLLARTLSRRAGTRLTDVTSGFRATSARGVRYFADTYPAEYLGDTVESLVLGCRAGLIVRQVPVAMRPRLYGQPSHSPVKAAIYLSRAMLVLLLAVVRKVPPLAAEDEARVAMPLDLRVLDRAGAE